MDGGRSTGITARIRASAGASRPKVTPYSIPSRKAACVMFGQHKDSESDVIALGILGLGGQDHQRTDPYNYQWIGMEHRSDPRVGGTAYQGKR